MKNIIKFRLAIGFVISIFLLMTQCDKFTDVDFLTKNNFILDATSQEFDVKTKQQTYINALTVNGITGYEFRLLEKMGTNDTVIYYDNYSVRFIKDNKGQDYGEPVEIIGEWFRIEKSEPSSTTTHVSIDENNEYSERSLIIGIDGSDPLVMSNNITIKQKKKD